MPWTVSFGGFPGLASFLTDAPIAMMAALALSASAVGWILFRLRRPRSQPYQGAEIPGSRVLTGTDPAGVTLTLALRATEHEKENAA